jgi:hypothetical protein
MLPDEWLRALDMLRDQGWEVVSADRRTGTVVVRVPRTRPTPRPRPPSS